MATCEQTKRNGEVCGQDISKKPCRYHKTKAADVSGDRIESFEDLTDFTSNAVDRLKTAGTAPIQDEIKSLFLRGVAKVNAILDQIDPPQEKKR